MENKSLPVVDPIVISEWDSDTFHRRVSELEAGGYVARLESYHIIPDINPETGEIIHLQSIELAKSDLERPPSNTSCSL